MPEHSETIKSGLSASVSLVVPVYRNGASLEGLVTAIHDIALAHSGPLEAIFVVDGSPDNCFDLLLAQLPQARFSSRLMALSRNFGAFAAVREGLRAASGQYLAVMAADLQEPPALVSEFYSLLARGEADIVLGRRIERDDPFWTRVAARAFWWFYRRFVQAEMPEGGVDVFAITRRVRDALLNLEPSQTSLVGQLLWLGFNRCDIPYARQKRRHGTSGWTLRKKVNYMFDSLFAFTDLPIKIFLNLGLVGMLLCVVAGLVIFLARLLGVIDVPGYTPLALFILFSTALNLFGLGIVGQYAARAFEAAKQRPGAVVMREVTFSGLGKDQTPEA